MADIYDKKDIDMAVSTQRLYYTDSYCFEAEALLQGKAEDEKGSFLLVDRTIFHPQGGGQPSDTGSIQIGQKIFAITDVRYKDGEIRHYGVFEEIALNQRVSLKIDETKRLMHARLHSGGHVVAHLAQRLWPELEVVKGYHFPDSPYMECANATRQQQPPSFIEDINEAISQLLLSNSSVGVSFAADLEDPQSRRFVQFAPEWLDPCGGTHVKSLSELQGLEVTKLKYAKGLLRVSYRI